MGYFVDYICNRIQNENKNAILCIVGATGTGKSLSAIRLCELISKKLRTEFNENNMVFSFKEMMQLLNGKKLVRGSCIMFDEAGIGLGSRNWYTTLNKMISFLLQAFRKYGYVLIFTVPNFSFIDKQTRHLLHGILQTKGIDFKRKLCKLHPLLFQDSPMTDKIYKKHLRVKGKVGEGVIEVKQIMLDLPSKELIDVYEDKKDKFLKKLNEDILRDIDNMEVKVRKGGRVACLQCGHTWEIRGNNIPLYCPKCNSKRWNKPRLKGEPLPFKSEYVPQLPKTVKNITQNNEIDSD